MDHFFCTYCLITAGKMNTHKLYFTLKIVFFFGGRDRSLGRLVVAISFFSVVVVSRLEILFGSLGVGFHCFLARSPTGRADFTMLEEQKEISVKWGFSLEEKKCQKPGKLVRNWSSPIQHWTDLYSRLLSLQDLYTESSERQQFFLEWKGVK